MNIDFHYGVMYVVARLAGLDQQKSGVVAHSCQYVDDASTSGILNFSGGESFERFASAHAIFDYINNSDNKENRLVWAPFHFLPGGEGDNLEDKVICRSNSLIAQEMMARTIKGHDSENSLHRLGISLHVYVDTWAHQGFSGIISEINQVSELTIDDSSQESWIAKMEDKWQSKFVDLVSGLGHGGALHFPDMPWAKWQYKNGKDEVIKRDNLPEFIDAANMSCKAIQGFINNNSDYQSEAGLPPDSKESLEKVLGGIRDHEEKNRLKAFSQAVKDGAISGIQEDIPIYIAKGEGSWKHEATGIAEINDGNNPPEWSSKFERSNYRKFHDAIKQHRFVITQELLPKHGLRLA